MNSKATVRPWKQYAKWPDIITDTEGGSIAQIECGFPCPEGTNEANAALIVQAVNSFDVMLAALKAVRDAFSNDMTTLEQNVAIRAELESVCAAIKLAEVTP